MRLRVLLLTTATTSGVVIAFLVPLLLLVREVAESRAVAAANAEVQSLAPVVATMTDERALEISMSRYNAANDGRRTTLFLPDGGVLGAPAEPDESVRLARTGAAFTADVPGGKAVLAPVVMPTGRLAVVRSFVPRATLDAGIRRASAALLLLGLALLVLSMLVATLLARSLTRPLLAVAGTADRLRSGDLRTRAAVGGPPEVRRIAGAFNRLADRIEDLVQGEREAVANLSHGLRTPLTALRLDAEGLCDPEEAERMLAHADALERAVTRLIHRARQPSDQRADAVADLVAVVAERTCFWSVLAEDQGRPLGVHLPDEQIPVPLAAEALAAAVDALLGNVFAHTDNGISMTVAVMGGAVPTLVIEDAGPGIADARLLRRGASGAASSGLGLDIAQHTARQSGGGLELYNLTPRGLRAVLRFGSRDHG